MRAKYERLSTERKCSNSLGRTDRSGGIILGTLGRRSNAVNSEKVDADNHPLYKSAQITSISRLQLPNIPMHHAQTSASKVSKIPLQQNCANLTCTNLEELPTEKASGETQRVKKRPVLPSKRNICKERDSTSQRRSETSTSPE